MARLLRNSNQDAVFSETIIRFEGYEGFNNNFSFEGYEGFEGKYSNC